MPIESPTQASGFYDFPWHWSDGTPIPSEFLANSNTHLVAKKSLGPDQKPFLKLYIRSPTLLEEQISYSKKDQAKLKQILDTLLRRSGFEFDALVLPRSYQIAKQDPSPTPAAAKSAVAAAPEANTGLRKSQRKRRSVGSNGEFYVGTDAEAAAAAAISRDSESQATGSKRARIHSLASSSSSATASIERDPVPLVFSLGLGDETDWFPDPLAAFLSKPVATPSPTLPSSWTNKTPAVSEPHEEYLSRSTSPLIDERQLQRRYTL